MVLAAAPAARADDPYMPELEGPKYYPRRANGPFGGFAAGIGILDPAALYNGTTTASDNAVTNLGLLDVSLRAGWRFELKRGLINVAPIAEARAGLIFGTVSGSAQRNWALLGGGQVQFRSGQQVMPFLNFRAGVRSETSTDSETVPVGRHSTYAMGLGIELPFGPYSTILELSFEPKTPYLVSFRAGVIFF